jgi:hypothetical protein
MIRLVDWPARRRAAAASFVAFLVVAAWNVASDQAVRAGGVPSAVAWMLLVAEFGLGWAAAPVVPPAITARLRGVPRRPGLAAVGAAVGAAALLAIVMAWLRYGGDPVNSRVLLVLAIAAVVAWGIGAATAIRAVDAPFPSLLLVAEVVAIWLVHDQHLLDHANHSYDLGVYVAAGSHWLAGQPVYLPGPITELPHRAADDFFLYPPPLIPVLALAARLPFGLLAGAWAVVSFGCALLAFRLLGLGWPWAILMLAFPALVKGAESGNVANLTFLLFAAGYRYGPALVVGVLFKIQTGIPALWLARERRWRDIVIGILIVGVVCLVTLPIVGVASWHDWLAGLGYRQQSQVNLPILNGLSLAGALPFAAFAAVSAVAIAIAFVLGGRRGLAGLGLASVVASPSLWPHGFLMALPAVFGFASGSLLWLALGLGADAWWGLWLTAALGAVSVLARRWEDRPIAPDVTHPLGGTFGPWARDRLP